VLKTLNTIYHLRIIPNLVNVLQTETESADIANSSYRAVTYMVVSNLDNKLRTRFVNQKKIFIYGHYKNHFMDRVLCTSVITIKQSIHKQCATVIIIFVLVNFVTTQNQQRM